MAILLPITPFAPEMLDSRPGSAEYVQSYSKCESLLIVSRIHPRLSGPKASKRNIKMIQSKLVKWLATRGRAAPLPAVTMPSPARRSRKCGHAYRTRLTSASRRKAVTQPHRGAYRPTISQYAGGLGAMHSRCAGRKRQALRARRALARFFRTQTESTITSMQGHIMMGTTQTGGQDLEKYFASYVGMEGGNPRSKIWFCDVAPHPAMPGLQRPLEPAFTPRPE